MFSFWLHTAFLSLTRDTLPNITDRDAAGDMLTPPGAVRCASVLLPSLYRGKGRGEGGMGGLLSPKVFLSHRRSPQRCR
jgi:hypothetical protein